MQALRAGQGQRASEADLQEAGQGLGGREEDQPQQKKEEEEKGAGSQERQETLRPNWKEENICLKSIIVMQSVINIAKILKIKLLSLGSQT